MIIEREGINLPVDDIRRLLSETSPQFQDLRAEAITGSTLLVTERADDITPILEQRVEFAKSYRENLAWYNLVGKNEWQGNAHYWQGTLERLSRLPEVAPKDLEEYVGVLQSEEDTDYHVAFSFEHASDIVKFLKKRVKATHVDAQLELKQALSLYPDLDVARLLGQIERGESGSYVEDSERIEAAIGDRVYGLYSARFGFVYNSLERDGYVRDIDALSVLPLASNVPHVDMNDSVGQDEVKVAV